MRPFGGTTRGVVGETRTAVVCGEMQLPRAVIRQRDGDDGDGDGGEMKSQESRVRRMARQNGYVVQKSRGAMGLNNHGLYRLVDPFVNAVMVGWDFDATLDDIEEWLSS